MIYERVAPSCACVRAHATRYVHSDLRSSLFGTAPVFGPIRTGPIHDRSRSSGILGQSVATLRPSRPFYIYRPALRGYVSCVLFAYFVLRTRRICPSHFRHVCLCSSVRSIDGDVDATRFLRRHRHRYRHRRPAYPGGIRRKVRGERAGRLLSAPCTCASLSTILRLHGMPELWKNASVCVCSSVCASGCVHQSAWCDGDVTRKKSWKLRKQCPRSLLYRPRRDCIFQRDSGISSRR